MKFSEQWLYEWVKPEISRDTLIEQLTMAGLEVDGIIPVAGDFTGVVVGEVVNCEPHPDADRLSICEVDVNESQCLHIVCGGKNVRAGLKVAVATIGARLPGDFKIKKSKLRGAVSEGMLCSASELGLAEQSEGIMELPVDAPIGEDLREYLHLEDIAIDIDLTPNRGDCLSLQGVAREVAVINRCELTKPTIDAVPEQTAATQVVSLAARELCPIYVGRKITGINATATTPLWMQEKLRRSGIRAISPVVDVTNYVMLELGQPMHAFDCAKIHGDISVRLANDDETITLLDGQQKKLTNNTLIIADKNGPLAIAGVMGGEDSAVTDDTADIFLESAFFTAKAVAGKGREYGMTSDSLHRFERGVDPTIQAIAVERATALLLDIVGGQAGPMSVYRSEPHVPTTTLVPLRIEKLNRTLGIKIPESEVSDILHRLGMQVFTQGDRWEVNVPSHRSDISIEADLIEEVVRIYGYNELPYHSTVAALKTSSHSEAHINKQQIADILVARGYCEAISYSFVNPKLQQKLKPEVTALTLVNPISADMAAMRTTLWSSLLEVASDNHRRQKYDLKLFEMGLQFVPQTDGELQQTPMLAGLVTGCINPRAWSESRRPVDFYDVKNDVCALLSSGQQGSNWQFISMQHASLHPGQAANIVLNEKIVGRIGALHPSLHKEFGFTSPVFLFECELNAIQQIELPKFKAWSKYPSIRRDLSLTLDEPTPSQQVISCVQDAAGDWLQSVDIFDVYHGENVPAGKKSLAITMNLQDETRTLEDTEVNNLMEKVIWALQEKCAAYLREE